MSSSTWLLFLQGKAGLILLQQKKLVFLSEFISSWHFITFLLLVLLFIYLRGSCGYFSNVDNLRIPPPLTWMYPSSHWLIADVVVSSSPSCSYHFFSTFLITDYQPFIISPFFIDCLRTRLAKGEQERMNVGKRRVVCRRVSLIREVTGNSDKIWR